MLLNNPKDILLSIAMIFIAMHAAYLCIKLYYPLLKSHKVSYRSEIDSSHSSRNVFSSRYINLLIATIEITIISLYINLLVIYPITTDTDDTDISTRIENISDNLSEASSELSTIQKELEARIETVEELKAEADIAENMISLSEEQVNAIQAKIHQEVNANSGKSLLQSILVSLFFFLLGLIVNPIFRIIKNKFSKTANDDYTAALQTAKYSDEELEQAVKLLDTIKHQQNND